MTNGMDPVMRVDISMEIAAPTHTRASQFLQVFKHRNGFHAPDNPLKKVTLTIHVPSEPDAVFNGSNLEDSAYSGKILAFDNTVGSLTKIVLRSSLEDVVHNYFFRDTLQSVTQTIVSDRNLTCKDPERISLYSIFYSSHVDIQEKMEFITKGYGVWIREGRWSHSVDHV